MRPASNDSLADRVRAFTEDLERQPGCQDWQVRQAEQALRIYFVNFLKRGDWHQQPKNTVVGGDGRTNPLEALEELRRRIRTRHYAYRTERSYVDWVRRFFAYAADRQGLPHPRADADMVRDYLTHLAVQRHVSASTQNQALCALLLLCREVLGFEPDDLSVRAKRGTHLPVVLSVPETAALLGAMRGTTWLMAALIYGGGLRVSECCELRIKDIDFDQGLIYTHVVKELRNPARSPLDSLRDRSTSSRGIRARLGTTPVRRPGAEARGRPRSAPSTADGACRIRVEQFPPGARRSTKQAAASLSSCRLRRGPPRASRG
jgi:integrase